MLEKCVKPGQTKTIIEYSSGSTVVSMSLIARAIHNLDDVHAFLSNKTTEAKLKMMRFFGLHMLAMIIPTVESIELIEDRTLFGGPSQPDPWDPRGGIQKARQLALEHEGIANPNQYETEAVCIPQFIG